MFQEGHTQARVVNAKLLPGICKWNIECLGVISRRR